MVLRLRVFTTVQAQSRSPSLDMHVVDIISERVSWVRSREQGRQFGFRRHYFVVVGASRIGTTRQRNFDIHRL